MARRWPEGPPHLALNPPCLLFFGFSFFFLSFLCFLIQCFPPEKGIFCIFECLPLFFLSLFWPPPFSIFLSMSLSLSLSLSFSLYISLSLSLSCSCPFSFLLVFIFCFLLVPYFCLFLSFSFFFAFVSWKEQHQNIELQHLLHQYFLVFLVFCLVFCFKSLFLIFAISWF